MPNPDQLQEDMGKFQVAERPISKFHDESVSNSCSESQSRAQQAEKKAEEEKEEDEDDGFRTPTSLEHRIPETKQCPPPPRKIKSSLKRKANSNSTTSFRCRIRNPLDLSKDLNLLLFPTQHNPLPDSHQNPKKSRRK